MKTNTLIPSGGASRSQVASILTCAVLSAVLLDGVSVQAATTSQWTATAAADFNVAADWTPAVVPTNLTTYVVDTNSFAIDISVGDTNIIGGLYIGTNYSGTVNMTGGTLNVSNSAGQYVFILGGGVPATGSLAVGGPGAGTFNMSGGTLNVFRDTGGFQQDSFIMGDQTGSSGTFNLSGGIVNAWCGVEMGCFGASILNISGGSFVDTGWFHVGQGNNSTNADASGAATFNLSGGALYLLPNNNGATYGNGGNAGMACGQDVSNAVVNISGGTLYACSMTLSSLSLSLLGPETNILNISGGTLYLGNFGVNSNSTAGSSDIVDTINISGGTFHTVDMLVFGLGATIGSTNADIKADGTNWSWTASLPVNLTNSSFAVTNGINGNVTGPGYVTFAPEATRTITLNNNWSGPGAMVINGPGFVNMSEASGNTYTGGTTVNGTLIFGTAQPGSLISGITVAGGGVLALASAQTNAITGVATLNSGSVLALNNNGALFESSASIPAGVSLVFNTTGTTTFTNVVTGGGNVALVGGGVVNVGSNLQNAGTITQSNGIFVVNGSILNASTLTNSSSATLGPLLAQGTIMATIGIGTNSSMEMGNTLQPATLTASNVVLNGTWIEKINTATTVGGGVNDLLICSNLTLNPSSVLAIDPQSAPSAGSYVIAEYTGTLTGTFGTLTNGTGDSMSLSYATPGEVILNVGTVNQANLTWSTPQFGSTVQLWDVNTSTNWLNGGVISTFHQQDAVTFSAAPSPTLTNRVSVTGQIIPSSITISGGLAYLIAGTGFISGDTGITDTDTNTVAIFTGGNNYTGPVNINNGVLQLGSGGSSWLGTSNTTTVNGGTLDLNAQGVGAEPLVIQGTGSAYAGTNNGAINNSSTTSPGQSAGPLNVTLAGDTTLNASGNRWDIGVATLGAGGGSFAGNSHNLTKIGNQAIWMHELGDIGVNNITISNGLLGFEYTIGMGLSSGTATVEPGATLGFYQLSSNSILNKQLVLNNNATLSSGGGTGSSNNFIGPITLNGTNAITTSIYPLDLLGNITGTGGFALSGTGPLYLGGADTYSGPTIIGPTAALVLNSSASIPDTSLIYLTPSANTILNVSAPGSITLNSGQTLEGSGDIIGNVTANPSSVITLGTNATTYGTIVFTNNLTLNGNTNYLKISDNNNIGIDNDLIYVNNQLTLSGTSTLIITPLAALNSSANYTIIESGGIASGGTANLKVISTSPRYTMTPVISGGNVQLSITGNSAPLEWEGYLTPNWDLVTSNWYNMGTASHDRFYNSDNPTFDDTASVTAVVVTNNVIVVGMNMSNVVKSYTFSGGGVITGPLVIEGNGSGAGGTTVLALSNAPAFTGIDSSAGTLVYNLQGLTNYTVAASITDSNGTGNSTIIFGGTNTATLAGDSVPAPNILGSYNPDFDGTIMVTNGVLQYTNVNALGVDASVNANPSFSPLIITNNGTLNFNGVAAGPSEGAPLGGEKWIHISGNGYNGQGALVDSGNNQEPNGAFCNLYFDSNATIHIVGTRCDQHVLSGNAEQVEGNGYNLTFAGGGAFFFNAQSDGDTHLGNIDVACTNGGRLAFQGGPLALGITTDYLTVEPGGEVTFYNFSNNLDSVYLGVQKNVWLKGNATIDSAGNAGSESNNFDCPIFLTGTNLIGTRYPMLVWGSIMDSNGPGGLILGNDSVGASGAALWLGGTNTYSGQTIVSNETLVVGVNSTLGLSTYVQVNSGATLDLSATPNYYFGFTATNQTMAGNGTVIGPATGTLYFNAGGTLAVGLPATNGLPQTNTFTLTMNNSAVFNSGSTNYVVANKINPNPGAVPVDKVTGLTSLTLDGALVITNYGTSFVAGDTLALFSATTITTNNTFNIVPATPGPNLAWNYNTFLTAGTLQVASTANPNPTNITFQVSGGQLTLSWPADHIGWQLQALTNTVRVGIVTNTPIGNNWANFNPSTSVDSVNIPINLTNGTVFYRLVY
jgi:fibronectin-binding autotransporter adhesin